MWRKMQLFIACGATVGATLVIFTTILVLIGWTDFIEWYFPLHIIVGSILSYKFLWPFYSKNLKLPIED